MKTHKQELKPTHSRTQHTLISPRKGNELQEKLKTYVNINYKYKLIQNSYNHFPVINIPFISVKNKSKLSCTKSIAHAAPDNTLKMQSLIIQKFIT